jgi:hypothetical protein
LAPNHYAGRIVAKLTYTALTSLDGFVSDENGNFDWAEPDAEVHRFVNDLERPIGTLPGDVHAPLELLDERRFAGGVVYLRYRPKG